jgi:hypothetical protein
MQQLQGRFELVAESIISKSELEQEIKNDRYALVANPGKNGNELGNYCEKYGKSAEFSRTGNRSIDDDESDADCNDNKHFDE